MAKYQVYCWPQHRQPIFEADTKQEVKDFIATQKRCMDPFTWCEEGGEVVWQPREPMVEIPGKKLREEKI